MGNPHSSDVLVQGKEEVEAVFAGVLRQLEQRVVPFRINRRVLQLEPVQHAPRKVGNELAPRRVPWRRRKKERE